VQNVRKKNAKHLNDGQIKFVVGDGRKGYNSEAPYDAIHVGAAAGKLPQEVDSFRVLEVRMDFYRRGRDFRFNLQC
jgi:hypothetical protein